jgi:hypothetical protein
MLTLSKGAITAYQYREPKRQMNSPLTDLLSAIH